MNTPQILLLTAKFAPEVGGVCAVAEALAANLPENITVVASKNPVTPHPILDWAAYDRRFSFPVHRVASLETELPRTLPGRLRGPLQFAVNALWTRPRALFSLSNHLRRRPTDVLLLNSLSCYWASTLKRFFPQLKIVCYLHGEEVNDGPHKRKLDLLAQQALRKADAVITVSTFTRDRALRCGISPHLLTVIPNGVDTTRFTPGPPSPALIARHHLQGKKVLLCLARLDERKGQDKLIEAMPAILTAVPETILLIVGGGTDAPRLQSLVHTLHLESSVLLTGPAPAAELVDYYRTADVYAMPNRTTPSGDTEGFGLVFLEAGACAKPVIGGRAGGVPDAILEGETGLLVDGTSTPEVAAACIRLLTDPTLAAQLAQNALHHSHQNSWPAQSQKVLTLCRTLAEA